MCQREKEKVIMSVSELAWLVHRTAAVCVPVKSSEREKAGKGHQRRSIKGGGVGGSKIKTSSIRSNIDFIFLKPSDTFYPNEIKLTTDPWSVLSALLWANGAVYFKPKTQKLFDDLKVKTVHYHISSRAEFLLPSWSSALLGRDKTSSVSVLLLSTTSASCTLISHYLLFVISSGIMRIFFRNWK